MEKWIKYSQRLTTTYQGTVPGQWTFGAVPWFSSLLVAPGFSK
ncbi:hypothetical protein [Paenibacillus sp. NPDC093718]